MRTSGSDGLRTLVIGIDAGCFNVLDPMLDAGSVPTIAGLIDDGIAADLESQIPPWTPSAWPSVYTGANPGKHGVFGFLSFDGYDWTVVDSTHVREHAIWDLLDLHGFTSVVVNAPITHPPPAIDGAVVPGYVAPEHPTCHPAGLLDDLREAIGDYRVYTPSMTETVAPDRKVRELAALAESRGAATCYLYDRFDPDFGFVQFQATDTVLHEFPGDREKAARVYEAVDGAIDEILDACRPETVVLVSDHGMDAYDTRVALNEHLRRHGYVEATRSGDGMPTWAAIRDTKLAAGEAGERAAPSLPGRLMQGLARAGITSQRVGAVLDRLGLAEATMRVVPDDLIRAGSEQVDFPNSTAYMRSRIECGIRLNLAGREPEGVVPADEYDRTREALIDLLSELETPDGEPVFDAVVPREAVFEGPYVDEAVDLLTIPNEFEFYLTTWLTDDVFDRPERATWDHTMEGILVAAGDGIDPDATAGSPHLFDVAPTVLATVGVPVSDRMDGAPLPFVDHPGTDTYPETGGAARGTTDDDVESRLSNLGYLER
ncbi:MAG: alkaline phosphatase family protein [Haloferacaceae archaeon]